MRNLKCEVDGFSDRKRATAQTISQGFAFEQLGDYIGRTFVFTNVKNGQNIGMVQGSRGPGLLSEALQAVGVGGKSRGQDFDGNVTSQSRVARLVHLAHTAGANLAGNFVRPDLLSSDYRHGRAL